MEQYIALLRGINLGNRNKVLMADLRELFNRLGFVNVKTYIQTGNVVFRSNKSKNISELSSIIEKEIYSVYGFAVPIILVAADELYEIVNNNPFVKTGITDIKRFHLTFLKEIPASEELMAIENKSNISNPDRFIIVGKTVFIYCSKLYQDTKFGNNFFEKNLKVKASTRNWKTVLKLSALLD